MYLSLFSNVIKENPNCRIAEKTPGNVKVFPILAKLFPESPLIHIVRDGRDVVNSYLKQKWIDLGTGNQMPITIDSTIAAKEWAKVQTQSREYKEKVLANYLEIKYEDLVLQPESVMKIILNFCGEEYEPSIMEYYKKKHSETPEASSHQVNQPVYSNSVGKWKNELSIEDRRVIDPLITEELIRLGYEQDTQWAK